MDALLDAALKARENAYAPYSGFKVGAALLARDGSIYTGCNVENASYGLTVCAERNAVFSGVASGAINFEKIVVAADGDLTPPCGMCLQVLREFGVKTVVLVNLERKWRSYTLDELLPVSFGPENL
ncbi:MAG: cytidine deaminase [Bacillota bacterium]|nr:cytidine deaminase [Bacillota bacterium]HOL14332.1 cytidine deaminase [Bacillota bacterium]HOP53148.1 cytidine deaminase [Bacillota bacterium]HPQ09816.1 cytidine deaminase [Bacillota bacterium]HPT60073.1 cytidine deaminase [Bacillota bacterium]